FKIEDINSGFLLSPYLVLLQQLPTRKEIIAKHRFFTYLIISIPFNILFLVSIYLLTPFIHDTMTIVSYTVFSIFWLCFSIYIVFSFYLLANTCYSRHDDNRKLYCIFDFLALL